MLLHWISITSNVCIPVTIQLQFGWELVPLELLNKIDRKWKNGSVHEYLSAGLSSNKHRGSKAKQSRAKQRPLTESESITEGRKKERKKERNTSATTNNETKQTNCVQVDRVHNDIPPWSLWFHWCFFLFYLIIS